MLLPTPHAAPHAAAKPNLLRGLLAMAGLCALSGFAGALTERLMKDPSRRSSLWVRNLQMALFSTPMAAATVLIVDGAALHAHGPWVGFNRWLLLTIGLGALGGIAVSFVFRFADNILKSFAVGCSIALNCVLSSLIFGLVVDRGMALGIGLVALASTVYNVPPECVWNGLAWSGVLPTMTTNYEALPLREVELTSAQTPGQMSALRSVATRSTGSPAMTS
jgi:UDP-sugar transporter A1/2/3